MVLVHPIRRDGH